MVCLQGNLMNMFRVITLAFLIGGRWRATILPAQWKRSLRQRTQTTFLKLYQMHRRRELHELWASLIQVVVVEEAITVHLWDSTERKTALSGRLFLSMKIEPPSHLLMSDVAMNTTLQQSMTRLIAPDERASSRGVEGMPRWVVLTVTGPSVRLQRNDIFPYARSCQKWKEGWRSMVPRECIFHTCHGPTTNKVISERLRWGWPRWAGLIEVVPQIKAKQEGKRQRLGLNCHQLTRWSKQLIQDACRTSVTVVVVSTKRLIGFAVTVEIKEKIRRIN